MMLKKGEGGNGWETSGTHVERHKRGAERRKKISMGTEVKKVVA